MIQTADGGRAKERNLDSKVQTQVRAQQSGESGERDRYQDLIDQTASVIVSWAFWKWLGRRPYFIPYEAYESITVRANGWIVDAGACAVSAAFQRHGRPWVGLSTPSPAEWIRFVAFVQASVRTRNVLKGDVNTT